MDVIQYNLDIKDNLGTQPVVDVIQYNLDIKDNLGTQPVVDVIQYNLDMKDTIGTQPSGCNIVQPGYRGHPWDTLWGMLYSTTWIQRIPLGPNLVDVIQ